MGPIPGRAGRRRQNRPMQGTLTCDGSHGAASRADIEQHFRDQVFFWLDLDGVDDDAHDLLQNTLNLHQLAVSHAQEFGQRPKIEDYDDFAYMVVLGASGSAGGGPDSRLTVEVHFIVAEHFVITIHHDPCLAMDAVRERIGHRKATEFQAPQVALLYLIIDQLVDGFFPILDAFDTKIDDLEDAILVQPTEDQLGTLFTMKRTLVTLRKVITPQRDMFASITSGVETLPGMTDDGQRYLRDIYDHLIRISDLVDGYRDLLSSVMDTHLSTVSNRLNVVMKQLTIIATIFLPLSFITGFFGQNFAWLVQHIGSWQVFVGLGLGLNIAAAAGLYYLFRRRGWLGGPTN
jgi:magnesium transporter